MTRKIFVALLMTFATAVAAAGDIEFSLNFDSSGWPPDNHPRTKARLAEWNDPMGRLMYHFNQSQAWIMRGTMPGSERDSGLAIRIKAQNGIPLQLVAASVQSGLDLAHQDLVSFKRPEPTEDELEGMDLAEQLTERLSRRLVPQ